MKSFKQFVNEDGAIATGGAGFTGPGPSTTANIASYESPLGKKPPVAVEEEAPVDKNASKIVPVTSRGV